MAALPPWKEQPVPTEQKLGGPHRGVWSFLKKTKYLAPARIETRVTLLTA